MSNNPESHLRAQKRPFPRRVLIADIAHPDREEVELEPLPNDCDWNDPPTASYILEGDTAA